MEMTSGSSDQMKRVEAKIPLRNHSIVHRKHVIIVFVEMFLNK